MFDNEECNCEPKRAYYRYPVGNECNGCYWYGPGMDCAHIGCNRMVRID
jgi:hypothetical protein